MIFSEYSAEYHIGYGAIPQAAEVEARRNCQQASGLNASCGSMLKSCEKQESNQSAWYCSGKNSLTGAVFGQYGASKVQAKYKTLNSCVASHEKQQALSCYVFDSDCLRL
jgi:hypothetical protein